MAIATIEDLSGRDVLPLSSRASYESIQTTSLSGTSSSRLKRKQNVREEAGDDLRVVDLLDLSGGGPADLCLPVARRTLELADLRGVRPSQGFPVRACNRRPMTVVELDPKLRVEHQPSRQRRGRRGGVVLNHDGRAGRPGSC